MGNLLINVSYANFASPVAKVTARVMNQMFEEEFFIDDGKSKLTKLPNGIYSVFLAADGFVEEVISSVKSEENTTTIANAEMFPRSILNLEGSL